MAFKSLYLPLLLLIVSICISDFGLVSHLQIKCFFMLDNQICFFSPAPQSVQFPYCNQQPRTLYFFVASREQSPASGPLFLVGLKPKPFR